MALQGPSITYIPGRNPFVEAYKQVSGGQISNKLEEFVQSTENPFVTLWLNSDREWSSGELKKAVLLMFIFLPEVEKLNEAQMMISSFSDDQNPFDNSFSIKEYYRRLARRMMDKYVELDYENENWGELFEALFMNTSKTDRKLLRTLKESVELAHEFGEFTRIPDLFSSIEKLSRVHNLY